jgi:drug/metabolite transporter (DMT)-like permease
MSIGQILFKKTALSMSSLGALGLIDGVLKAIFIPWLYMALCVYGLATIFWLYLLQRIPITIAYPFSALAMIIVPILAIFIFGDKLSFSYWIGLFLIVSGITIIAQ